MGEGKSGASSRHLLERIKKFLRVYIIITVQRERWNTTAGQEHIQ